MFPVVDAEVVQQRPEMGDELAALREALPVRLLVAVGRGVEQRLHPQERQHLPGVIGAPRALMRRRPQLTAKLPPKNTPVQKLL